MILQHKFVEFIPEQLEDGVLYISLTYCTAIHKCACGCSNEVVTPFAPNDWKMTFDGKTISLSPSIGNWNFDCRSHYWIRNSEIILARQWDDEEIKAGSKKPKKKKKKSFSKWWHKKK
ncbi:DUF6527 family protein [Flavobacterium sp. TAB 87]|uniref:DUF6527 family protein n=1 Tax=Flavobacterium sp. TAB 87 TaxID=1729581 RepID=UPI00076C75DB|nr:DUF6527 family protein [Flavobacterium sp. TAB 87]KVV15039.1 hypothetical protein AP058_01597 [Flavobacterium sp. TAB 87]